ncbi:MAG: LA_3659 family protein, partial [Spirochaetota bacterium]
MIVLVILAVYRQLDKNNRSLTKIKRYSEKIKEELD